MKYKFPRYLSQPYQLLWLEPDDMMIALLFYLLAMLFGGWYMYLLIVVVPLYYGKMKRKYPRGFLKHCLYFAGLIDLKGYPSSFIKRFIE